MTIPNLPNIIDSAQLARIKNNFLPRDRVNSEYSDQISSLRQNPQVLFSDLSTPSSLSEGTMRGLTYPLTINESGGLSISSGYERIGQQIYEVLDTRFGERVYRPFLGTPELLFETISESLIQQTIKSQILYAIPYLREDDIKVNASMMDSGLCEIAVYYSTSGANQGIVKYQFSPQ